VAGAAIFGGLVADQPDINIPVDTQTKSVAVPGDYEAVQLFTMSRPL